MARGTIIGLGLYAGLGGCSFDSGGLSRNMLGDPASTDTGEPQPVSTADPWLTGGTSSTTGVGSGSAEGSTGLGTTSSTTAVSSGNLESSGVGTDGGSSESTGTPDPCANPPPLTLSFTVDQGTLEAPMQLGSSIATGSYAYSEQAGEGSIAFAFDVACADMFQVWARVNDADPLDLIGSDPDSFLVDIDEDGSTPWDYGCQLDLNWDWRKVYDNDFCVTSNDAYWVLSPGPHVLRFVNVEAGVHEEPDWFGNIGAVAAISEVVISSDPNYSP